MADKPRILDNDCGIVSICTGEGATVRTIASWEYKDEEHRLVANLEAMKFLADMPENRPFLSYYLGDGVYMSFGDDMIRINADHNIIYLDRDVFSNLLKHGAGYFGYKVTVELKR